MALYDDAWMKSFQEQWNAEPALKDALAKIDFNSVIGYGFPGDDQALGFVDVRAGECVEAGAYDGVVFHRVIEGFMAQTGIHGDPAVNREWRAKRIKDDPVRESNTEGMVTFATSGIGVRKWREIEIRVDGYEANTRRGYVGTLP